MNKTERYHITNQEESDRLIERKKAVAESTSVQSVDQLRALGLSSDQIHQLCQQVSHEINRYNAAHPSEMLSKSPEVILSQLETGLSVLIFTQTTDGLQFLYHGTSYEVLDQNVSKMLNTQILEFGSAITHPDFRAGYGLGTRGARARVGLLEKYLRRGQHAFGLSTIKQMITGRVWSKTGAEAISFWDVPYLSYLTDTCADSSERYGHQSCLHRRSPADSSSEQLRIAVGSDSKGGYLPCTLIVTDRKAAFAFDQRARELHRQIQGIAVPAGDISPQSYLEIGRFFDSLNLET